MQARDVAQLSCLEVFAELSRDDLAELCALSPPRTYETGAVLFRQGDEVDTAYLVVDGLLEARVETEEGPRTVGEVQPGEVAGEAALLDPRGHRNATLVARAPTRVLLVSRQLLHGAARRPAIVALERHLVQTLARRIRATNRALDAVRSEIRRRRSAP